VPDFQLTQNTDKAELEEHNSLFNDRENEEFFKKISVFFIARWASFFPPVLFWFGTFHSKIDGAQVSFGVTSYSRQ
jgi:hypothetical protein